MRIWKVGGEEGEKKQEQEQGKKEFTTNKVIILLMEIKKSACFKNRESRKNKQDECRQNVYSATPKQLDKNNMKNIY